jgi:hypothetical protein
MKIGTEEIQTLFEQGNLVIYNFLKQQSPGRPPVTWSAYLEWAGKHLQDLPEGFQIIVDGYNRPFVVKGGKWKEGEDGGGE